VAFSHIFIKEKIYNKNMSFTNIKYWFKDNLFEIYVTGAIIILLGVSIYRFITNQNGKWRVPFDFKEVKKQVAPPSTSTCESKGESITRHYLFNKFNRPFDKVRNLYNPVTKHMLELDCYNEELQLAVEYQGKQHYVYTPHFHKNVEAFKNQQYRDELKRIYCRDIGILLIEVPYTIKHDDIPYYLDAQLYSYGII
jgi:hypothetical protein